MGLYILHDRGWGGGGSPKDYSITYWGVGGRGGLAKWLQYYTGVVQGMIIVSHRDRGGPANDYWVLLKTKMTKNSNFFLLRVKFVEGQMITVWHALSFEALYHYSTI